MVVGVVDGGRVVLVGGEFDNDVVLGDDLDVEWWPEECSGVSDDMEEGSSGIVSVGSIVGEEVLLMIW